MKSCGGPEPSRRCEISERLVPPGALIRVLHDGEEFDVGEMKVVEMFDHAIGHLEVAQRAVVDVAHPRAEMDLVDRHRVPPQVPPGSGGHPTLVAPLVGQVAHHRRRCRRHFVVEGERVCLVHPVAAVARCDVVLVRVTLANPGHEPRPDPGVALHGERVVARFPFVELADHRHVLGVRRPHGEEGSIHALSSTEVGAKLVVEAEMVPLVEEEQVVVGQLERSRIGGGFGHVRRG